MDANHTVPRKAPLILGRQQFDGLGRQLQVEVGGRRTDFNYEPGMLPVRTNTLPGGTVVEFDYERALENAVRRIVTGRDDTTVLDYDTRHNQITRISDTNSIQNMSYKPSGRLDAETWTIGGNSYSNKWLYSLAGKLWSLTDADQTLHRQRYDAFGRVSELSAGPVSLPDAMAVSITYDDFSRPHIVATTDASTGSTLTQTLAYDDFGRETVRTVDIKHGSTQRQLVQTLSYTPFDQVASRTWSDAGNDAVESFRYDLRGRLVEYTANDLAAPTDPFGNRIVGQVFTLNAYDGYETVVTRFVDGTQDTATFAYNPDDVTQVVRVEHTHPSWPGTLNVKYDERGNVTEDGRGRTLTWDLQNRLVDVAYASTRCEYRYDPSGKLAERQLNGTLVRSFYSGDRLTHEHYGEDERLTFLGSAQATFAQSRLSVSVQTALVTLLCGDAQGTVRVEVDEDIRLPRYTAHGDRHSDDLKSPLGFAGERVDEFTGWYVPGGYRPYDPVLMCFLSPDSDSPFGVGGLNPYAYCGGDPVNNIDPDGHGWFTWLAVGLGVVLGVVATVASLGAAAPAIAALAAGGIGALTAGGALAIASAGLGVVSLATGVAATVLDATGKDEKAASILGWISLGTGVLGAIGEMAPQAAKGIGRLSRMAGRGMKKSQNTAVKTSRKGLVYERNSGDHDVWFHENLYGEGQVAYETHGSPFGQLMDASGTMRNATDVAREDIAPRLAQLNPPLPPDQPITLIACFAGKSGAAQKVADELQRPVFASRRVLSVLHPSIMGSRVTSMPGMPLGNIIRNRRGGWTGLKDLLKGGEVHRPARWNLFLPRFPN